MISKLPLDEFLKENRIDEETWKKADIKWSILQEIAKDHEEAAINLENSAEFFAKTIQKFSRVHSVRWRVKSTAHLIAKIIRKRSEGNSKYAVITKENYFELVTDLVGVRALHLFKEDCLEIVAALNSIFVSIEPPVAYIREGDSDGLKKKLEENGFEVKNHPAGYRSIHFVTASTPLNRKIIAEIQIRTIFEEGWSEIDHKIRYPNYSDNELVKYFLEVFNRMAGSADDMGSFVLGLVATLTELKNEKDVAFQGMELALNKLESVKKQDKESKENLAKLKEEFDRFKEASRTNNDLRQSLKSPYAGFLGLSSLSKDNIDAIFRSSAIQAARGLTVPPLGLLDPPPKKT